MTYERDNGGPDALRREVRYAVGAVLTTTTNYPPSVQARLLGQDMGPLIAKTVDAVMEAMSHE